MPASETPTNPSRPEHPETQPPPRSEPVQDAVAVAEPPSEQNQNEIPSLFQSSSRSRYVDYDTHELLEKISQYEDERRWQRIREGIWISIIAHIIFFSGLTWIPKYVFHAPAVIDPFDAIRKRKDLTYLDEMPEALRQIQKTKLPALTTKETTVDKKTLESLKALEKPQPKPAAPIQAQEAAPPAPIPPLPQQQQPTPLPPSTATPQTNPQLALEPLRPSPVPARPNFSLNQPSVSDEIRQSLHSLGHGPNSVQLPPSHLNLHPSSSTGGVEVLSDMQGVSFRNWLLRWHDETQRTWDPLIPEETNPPISKRGVSVVRFKVLPSGRIMDGSMTLDGRAGDTALDRAAWGAITGSNYPPLPREFNGPYLELRAYFLYNMSQ